MSANVNSMFSVREMPWWSGTSEDHGKAAGLDWDPTEGSLRRDFTSADLADLRSRFARIMLDADLSTVQVLDQLTLAAALATPRVEGWKHIGRSDDPGVTLACTQDTYKVIANSEFGEIFTALMEQDNVKYETGGVLDGGRKVWLLALLDEPITLPGDDTATYPYMSLMSRHDARGSTALRATNVRVVCGNTFSMAELQGDRTGLTYSFIHRGNWRDHMDDARQAVNGVRAEARAYAQLSENLLLVPVTPVQRDQFVEAFFPMPPRGTSSDRVLSNVRVSRDKLLEILAGQTVRGAGVEFTAYGMLQAAGEYLDHVRTARSWETKLNRSMLTPEPAKARALSILIEVCDLDKAQLLAA